MPLVFSLPAVCADAPAPKPVPKPAPASSARPSLGASAARRNENVQVNRIDNDGAKESTIRLGDSVTLVPLPLVESGYFASEHGRAAGEPVALRPAPAVSGWHGEVFEAHQNSVFNARTFFQAGDVLPSRQNSYGARFSGAVQKVGALTGAFSQRKIRGMVNGNVLVPLASERTPLATGPAVRALVSRFLGAYPAELPNRPDFDPRALNTNAPQQIDETDSSLRLDRDTGARSRISLSHALGRQRVHAFQFVAGQNPDTEIHTHRSRAAWRYSPSAFTDVAVGLGFTRVKSVLHSEPRAVGPRVRIGFQIEELGPDSHFPIDRAQNSYRGGAVVTHRLAGGRHTLTFGGDATRFQLNGIETLNQRGYFVFSNNFGRSAIDNFRLGVPSTYEATLGEMARGFRNWQANLFLADQWKIGSRLQIYYGLRFSPETAPVEAQGRNRIPYGCDCNNLSPRFSAAYQLAPKRVMRASYTVSFGQILPVTYSQVRYNLPLARYAQIQNPDLLQPLRDLNLNGAAARTAPSLLSPDLVSPYSHQYNFSLENRLGRQYLLRAGYVGSRTFKLLNSYVMNRARPMPDVPLTTATVDQRRPDPRYYDVNHIVNGGIAYLDAGQVSLEAPSQRGLAWGATYTFGKAIDQGSDYLCTAANRDLSRGRSQFQYESLKDKKGLSNFDSTHAVMLYYSYDLPLGRLSRGLPGWMTGGWQLSGAGLLRSGTPLTLYIGSDAPGFGNVDGGPSDRPNILDPSILGRSIGNPNDAPLILRRDRFAYIVPGEQRGSLGRNTFRKGGIANFNAGVTKQWRWGGRRERAFLFRAEAANLANHPQFDEPQRNLSAPSFGKITNTLNDGRVLQFQLRVLL
ncbi:MAG: TonB-dependent receptor [Candidatus Solibacter usitatus]|nr:TonB-dependent receptor [Candidatus Solibacter usitatus]